MQAAYQLGGEPFKAWSPAMQEALLPAQREGGCVDGSWDPSDDSCGPSGRVEATALGALTLEFYYRYQRAAAAH